MTLTRFILILLPFVAASSQLLGLPIGFGTHQGEITYNEISSAHTRVYFDSRAPHEAAMVANSIEAAHPIVNSWLGQTHQTPMPIIVSAVTSGASFANFLTNAIELQTLGQGSRDLFWHEYTHMIMYKHFQNFLGPAGALFHLPWVPVWFIEGLAETVSLSDGSDWTSGIERFQALAGTWPSYDRMHSLYGGGEFARIGYATAGGFISWLWRHPAFHTAKLSQFLTKLDRYTWPDYYPQSVNPLSRFMPMDQALMDLFQADGKMLYERYRRETTKFWRRESRGPFLHNSPGSRMTFKQIPRLHSDGKVVYTYQKFDDGFARLNLRNQAKATWVNVQKRAKLIPMDRLASFAIIENKRETFVVLAKTETKTGFTKETIARLTPGFISGNPQITALTSPTDAHISHLFQTDKKLIWVEEGINQSRLCWLARHQLDDATQRTPTCPLVITLPKSLVVLGTDSSTNPSPASEKTQNMRLSQNKNIDRIWLGIHQQTLHGNRGQILVYNPADDTHKQLDQLDPRALALRTTTTKGKRWLLFREHGYRTLWQIDQHGQCQAELRLADTVTDMVSTHDGRIWLTLWTPKGQEIKILSRADQAKYLNSCSTPRKLTSPMIYALDSERHGARIPSLRQALRANHDELRESPPFESSRRFLSQAPPLDRAARPAATKPASTIADIRPARWRGRHVLTVPWLGADDALGPQLGLISLPIMDEMQNETLRLTFLYGVASRYPNTDLTLTSTRFWPSLNATLFRRQLYNGIARSSASSASSVSYLDDQGLRLNANWPFHFWRGHLNLETSMIFSERRRYLGPRGVLEGHLTQLEAQASYITSIRQFTYNLSLLSRIAPPVLNQNFDFYRIALRAGVNYRLPWQNATISGNTHAARTTGRSGKIPHLKEYYTPQRTFIAGSGGGYNQNSFSLTDDGSLFVPRFGNQKAGAEVKFQVPVWRSINRQIWLFYFDKLIASAFLNRGGAWFDGETPYRRMDTAYGYAADVLFENKGVRFNAGVGYGRVIDQPFQLYTTAGFDALF